LFTCLEDVQEYLWRQTEQIWGEGARGCGTSQ